MKTLISLAVLLIAGGPSIAGDSASLVSAPDVTVVRMALNLPADAQAAAKVLWDTFANKSEEMKFNTVTLRDWRQQYPRFVDELARRARESKLADDSLVQILKTIDQKRGSLAVLPVGAYYAHQGQKEIWIVVCKWEIENGSNSNVRIAHVRMFAYDVTSLEQVAFKTCM